MSDRTSIKNIFLKYPQPGNVVMVDSPVYVQLFGTTEEVTSFHERKSQMHPVELEATSAIAKFMWKEF